MVIILGYTSCVKKRDCQSTRHTKKEYNKVREGFKRYIHQYLTDNNIDDNFDKNIVPTTTSNNFFYDDYSIKHFITLNRLIPIKITKNIVIFINNNAFIYGLTNSTEPSTARYGNKVNIKNLIVNINFLNCHFNNNGQDLVLPPIFPYSL